MSATSFRAHYDGTQILLDDPVELAPDTRLLVTILSDAEEDRVVWLHASSIGLAGAYGPNEPDYPLELLKKVNGDYGRR